MKCDFWHVCLKTMNHTHIVTASGNGFHPNVGCAGDVKKNMLKTITMNRGH